MPEWISGSWFLPSTLQSFVWDSPLYFYFIGIIPLLYLLRWVFRGKSKRNLNLSLPSDGSGFAKQGFLRFLVPFFLSLAMLCLCLALAGPQNALLSDEGLTEGVHVVLALDVSESMKATDLKPNRLDAAKEAALDFLANRENDKIGLVVFAGEAKTMCPLTSDYGILKDYIHKVSWDLVKSSGTAIGDALASAINRLRDTPSKSKAIVLLSDGDNTAGTLAPSSAAELAKSFGIRIYTIGIGRNFRGLLKEASEKTEGAYFEAQNKAELFSIFEHIDSLERTFFENNRLTDLRDYYDVYLNWSIAFFILTFLLKNTFLGNGLED